jgi:hypothetical protein
LNDFSSEITENILHSINQTHKVPSGWLQAVGGHISMGVRLGRINSKYRNLFWSRRSKFFERSATKEDIEYVDSLLIQMISDIEERCSSTKRGAALSPIGPE